MFLPQTLIDLVKSGGGLKIDLKSQTFLPQTLIELASAAAYSGATVTIKISGIPILPDTMMQIASAGQGKIVFEI